MKYATRHRDEMKDRIWAIAYMAMMFLAGVFLGLALHG